MKKGLNIFFLPIKRTERNTWEPKVGKNFLGAKLKNPNFIGTKSIFNP